MPFKRFCTLAKHFLLRTFFIQANKKCRLEWGRVNGEGGGWGSCHLVKNCWKISTVLADVLTNHSSWNEPMSWKSLQKKFTKAERSLSHNTSWCTDTDGFLEHSPSRGSLCYKGSTLQKISALFLRSSPLICDSNEVIKVLNQKEKDRKRRQQWTEEFITVWKEEKQKEKLIPSLRQRKL